MKLYLALCTLTMATGLLTAAEQNPVYKDHSSNVIFHLSFDEESPSAGMANGNPDPKKPGAVEYAPGVFGGKCLAKGALRYEAKDNVDFSVPGTIIIWIAPNGWSKNDNGKGKGVGYTVFQAYADGWQFIMGMMGGQPAGVCHMNFYFYYPPSKHTDSTNFNSAGFKAPGEWKMIAATWNASSFTNTVNTKTAVGKKNPLPKPARDFVITASYDKDPVPLFVDEVVILDKELTHEELVKLYNDSLAVMQKAAPDQTAR